MPTIRTKLTRGQLLDRLRQLPGVLSGRQADPSGAARGLVLGMGTAILGKVQDNYLRCSEGGVNELTGEPWDDLSPVTLALRRKDSSAKVVARLQREFGKLPAHRQQLIRRQYARLLQVYGDTSALGTHNGPRLRRAALGILEKMKPNITPGRYKKLKAELTKRPAPEKAERLAQSGAAALILRDTQRGFNSLSPLLKGSGEQLLTFTPGELAVGTNVRYMDFHQSRRPRKMKKNGKPRLPRRQFLPDDANPMPTTWWNAGLGAVTQGLTTPSFWNAFLA